MLGVLKRNKTALGGELVSRMLAAEGVEAVFAIIDGTYFGICSTLERHGIRLVTPRHEVSAAHMAGAYARTTGKLGVCMASNGPGVANILPGVVVEAAEGNRVLLLTSARRTGISGAERSGGYQVFPQTEVTRPVTKWSARVPSFERLPDLLRKALRIAHTGRPGVVHVDIPEDILNGKFEVADAQVWEPASYRRTEPLAPTPAQVERAAEMLLAAERPLLQVGSGVVHAGASRELDRVARLLHAPVTTSWGARSAVDEREGYVIPMIHVGLTNEVRAKADVVLTLGSRLGETDWWGKAPYWGRPGEQRMIQVDVDEASLGLNRPVDLAVQACAKVFLEQLHALLLRRREEIDVAARRARLLRLQDERARLRAKLDAKLADRASPLHSAHVGHACRERFGDDAIVVFDGGNAAIWGNFFHEVRSPRSVLSTFKFGMLGAGVPQALGAKVAAPEREVFCILGDGAMGFQLQELETAVRNKLQVTYLVLCDRQWGMVKINQSFNLRPLKTLLKKSLDEDETINTDLEEIEFDALARAFGAHGERVSDPDALGAAIDRCRRQDGPSVIHVDVDPVKHMWAPALKDFKDLHAEPRG